MHSKNLRVFAKMILAFASGLLLCSCSYTTPTPLVNGADRVQFMLNEPTHCQRLGEIQGYKLNDYGNLSLQEMRNSAKNDLKNKAYEMNADTLVIIGTDNIGANGGYYTSRSFYYPYDMGFYVPYSYLKEYVIDAIAYKCR